MIFYCCKISLYVFHWALFTSRRACVSGNVAATWMRKLILTLPCIYWNIRKSAPPYPRFHWMCFTAGLHKRPTLFPIITNLLNKRPIKTMAPELNLPPNFHLLSAFCLHCVDQTCVSKSATLTSDHDLKTKETSPTCLPCRPFPSLPISRRLSGGSLKVNPRQELSDPPMLLRKFCVKPKDRQKQRTLRRGCGVSFTLPLSLFLACLFLSFLRFPGVIS